MKCRPFYISFLVFIITTKEMANMYLLLCNVYLSELLFILNMHRVNYIVLVTILLY